MSRTNEYKDSEPPKDACCPVVETAAHAADLGIVFYTGNKFPEKYKKGVFTAQHGSWNRTVPVGARVLFTPLNEDGTAGAQEDFAAGWLNAERRIYQAGRWPWRSCATVRSWSPTIFAGAVYRISYSK